MRTALLLLFCSYAHASSIKLAGFQEATYVATLPSWATSGYGLYNVASGTLEMDFAIAPIATLMTLADSSGHSFQVIPTRSSGSGNMVFSADVMAGPGTPYWLSIFSITPSTVTIDLNSALFGDLPRQSPVTTTPEPFTLLTTGFGFIALLLRKCW
jgi:hypothetical protein